MQVCSSWNGMAMERVGVRHCALTLRITRLTPFLVFLLGLSPSLACLRSPFRPPPSRLLS